MGDATGRRMSAPHPHTTNTQSAWRHQTLHRPNDTTSHDTPDPTCMLSSSAPSSLQLATPSKYSGRAGGNANKEGGEREEMAEAPRYKLDYQS